MLPRPLADLIALCRDLVRQPREVLLNRGHHQWRAAGLIAIASTPAWFGHRPNTMAALVILPLAGLSFALDVAGYLAHGLWTSGRIWKGVECQCCGDDPDDGHDDSEDADPDDGGGLALDVETWLRTQTTHTH